MSVLTAEETKTGLRVTTEGAKTITHNDIGKQVSEMDLSLKGEGIFVDRWIGFVTDEEMKAIMDGHYYRLFADSGCNKKICDTTLLEGSFDGVNEWFATYFLPKLMQAGLRYNAIVLPRDIFAQMAMNENTEQVEATAADAFQVRMFGSFEDARTWLKSL